MSVSAIGALERGTRRAPYRETVVLLAAALTLSEAERTELEAVAAQARHRSPAAREPVMSGNLPARMTSFVGRDREIEQLETLLATQRLVTLTGFGGVGKTRVAIELGAHESLELARYEDVEAAYSSVQHLSAVAAIQRHAPVAARLIGFVDAWRDEMKLQRGHYERATYEILMTSLREQLAIDQITNQGLAGSRLEFERAVDEALGFP